MKRYWLTLKATYLPGWNLYEGIRELVQNARDAELQDSAPMKVDFCYRVRNKTPVGTVVIVNEGTTIPKEAFLIGHTSKEGRSDLIGKFGEGFKFGILALLRIPGIEIKIRNGSESWNPVIARHKDYDAEVLAFDVFEGNKHEDRVQIEIIGVAAEDWNKIQEKFLFINPPHEATVTNVYGGKVLLSPQYKGMLFVKGMYVCTKPGLFYGYDADHADIDRDRRMLSNSGEVTANLLSAACKTGKLTSKVYELLHEGSPEVSQMYAYSLGEEALADLAASFRKQYGEDALPADSDEQVTELSHLGVRGVRLPYNLNNIIAYKLGTPKENVAKLKMNAKHTFSFEELDKFEQDNFSDALEYLIRCLNSSKYDSSLVDRISIVEFSDDELLGTYCINDKSIRLARHCLKKVSTTLRVLIHEAAHEAGLDGTSQHEAAIGHLTESMLSLLLDE